MHEKINERLRDLVVPLANLKLDPENARKHSQRSIDAVARSLATYGQQKPVVVDRDMVVRAGNGTVVAARQLGWEGLAVVLYDGEAPVQAFAIADNRTAELSEWDQEALPELLESLRAQDADFDPELLGFTEEEVLQLISSSQKAVDSLDVTAPETPRALGAAGQDPNVTGGPVWRDGVAERPGTPPAGTHSLSNPVAPPSHVRTVSLYLDDKTHLAFIDQVRMLGAKSGSDNVSDTVVWAVAELHRLLSEDEVGDGAEAG